MNLMKNFLTFYVIISSVYSTAYVDALKVRALKNLSKVLDNFLECLFLVWHIYFAQVYFLILHFILIPLISIQVSIISFFSRLNLNSIFIQETEYSCQIIGLQKFTYVLK